MREDNDSGVDSQAANSQGEERGSSAEGPTGPQLKPKPDDRVFEGLANEFSNRIADQVMSRLVPAIQQLFQVQPRYLSIESAAAYIDKTYEGMRYTLSQYQQEIPVVMVGDKPRIDIKDIDRFMANRKGRGVTIKSK